MKQHLRTSLLLLSLLILGSCSAKWPHQYDAVLPSATAYGFGRVVVVAADRRPQVLAGELLPEQVGTVRSVTGDSFPTTTASGKPFAHDISQSVCRALRTRGFDECLPLVAQLPNAAAEVDYIVRHDSPLRVLYFEVREWKIETYMQSSLNYEIALTLWSQDGRMMAAASTEGSDVLTAMGSVNPAKNASLQAPVVLRENLEALLNHEKIVKALSLVRPIDVLGGRY